MDFQNVNNTIFFIYTYLRFVRYMISDMYKDINLIHFNKKNFFQNMVYRKLFSIKANNWELSIVNNFLFYMVIVPKFVGKIKQNHTNIFTIIQLN